MRCCIKDCHLEILKQVLTNFQKMFTSELFLWTDFYNDVYYFDVFKTSFDITFLLTALSGFRNRTTIFQQSFIKVNT